MAAIVVVQIGSAERESGAIIDKQAWITNDSEEDLAPTPGIEEEEKGRESDSHVSRQTWTTTYYSIQLGGEDKVARSRVLAPSGVRTTKYTRLLAEYCTR